MTISDCIALGKRVPTRFRDALILLAIVLSSTASFGLGVMAGREEGGSVDGVYIEKPVELAAAAEGSQTPPTEAPVSGGGQYVASKSGTKYYLPWCGTAKRIKEENKVWFESKVEAEAAGYEPGKNCKGL